MVLTLPASQIPFCVESNHALHTLLPKKHLSADWPVPLFIKSVFLVSFSFCPLLFLPFELHSFPPIIHLSLPFFFPKALHVSILCPSFFVSSLLFPEAVPLLPASVVSEGWGKRCTSTISKNKDHSKRRVIHAEIQAINPSFWHHTDLLQHVGHGLFGNLDLSGQCPLGSLMQGHGKRLLESTGWVEMSHRSCKVRGYSGLQSTGTMDTFHWRGLLLAASNFGIVPCTLS